MSSIRFTSFGAATVPLSKIIVDKNLEMGQYSISADEIIADEIRAQKVYSPIDTEGLETEALDWGDGDPEQLYHGKIALVSPPKLYTLTTITGNHRVSVTLTVESGTVVRIWIKVNGADVAFMSDVTTENSPITLSPSFMVKNGDVITVYATGSGDTWITIENDGLARGEKTFDLTGKWLALGLDMKGLAATVKIQGVEIPYSDYEKYFPVAPTEITIPYDWIDLQERPVVKVYK